MLFTFISKCAVFVVDRNGTARGGASVFWWPSEGWRWFCLSASFSFFFLHGNSQRFSTIKLQLVHSLKYNSKNSKNIKGAKQKPKQCWWRYRGKLNGLGRFVSFSFFIFFLSPPFSCFQLINYQIYIIWTAKVLADNGRFHQSHWFLLWSAIVKYVSR